MLAGGRVVRQGLLHVGQPGVWFVWECVKTMKEKKKRPTVALPLSLAEHPPAAFLPLEDQVVLLLQHPGQSLVKGIAQ